MHDLRDVWRGDEQAAAPRYLTAAPRYLTAAPQSSRDPPVAGEHRRPVPTDLPPTVAQMTVSTVPTDAAEWLDLQLERLIPDLADSPAPEVERAAATLLVPFEEPVLSSELGPEFIAALERLQDPRSCRLLAALSRLAREPIARQASAALERLGASPAATGIGEARVREAHRFRGRSTDVTLVVLERPRDPLVQLVAFAVTHKEGVIAEAVVMDPVEPEEVSEFLDDFEEPSEMLEPDAVLGTLRAALERVERDADLAIPFGAAVALPIVSRALTGDPAALPRPPSSPPEHPLDVDPIEDEEGFHETVDLLVEEFHDALVERLGDDHPVAREGAFVCGSLLHWKGGYADGRLGHWTEDDLAEYLLDYFPRKVSPDEELIAATPDVIAAFMYHLEADDLLAGEPAAELAACCERLRPEFERRARDRSYWGPAKALCAQMEAEGVELGNQDALDAWLADFNSRPLAERDRVLGQMPVPAPNGEVRNRASTGGTAHRTRRAKRKTARAARRRNRR